MNLPFTWPIPSGFKVVTREGEEVTQLTKFDTVLGERFVGVYNGMLYSWNREGVLSATLESGGSDLFLTPIEKEVWIVVATIGVKIFGPFDTEDLAAQYGKNYLPAFSTHKIILP